MWSVIAYIENGIECKSSVPYHWVSWDEELRLLSWPQKDIVKACIKNWTKPTGKWYKFKIIKIMKEFGSKEICDEMVRMSDSTTGTDTDRTG